MSQDSTGLAVHPMLAVLGEIEAGVDRLGQTCDWSMSNADRAEFLDRITALEARLAAVKLDVVADADANSIGVADATDTAGWLRGRLLMHPGTARRAVRLARELRSECAATGAALGRGVLSAEHARVIVHAMGHLPPVEGDVKARAEEFLIEQAQVLDPLLLRRAAEALAETLTTRPDTDERLVRDLGRRELTAVPTYDGMIRVHGWYDREGWAEIAAVLDPLAAPQPAVDGTPDPRSAARRHADGLLAMARTAATATPAGGVRPVLTVTIGFEALSGQLARMGRLNTGEPITAAAARRIGCDANLIPVVLGSAGQPLDIGRVARVVPPPMRRALVCRDEACAFPGCDRLAAWSEAHHIIHWADGGPTALSNLVLLCLQHHHAVHHHGWTVTLDDDGLPTFRPPPWIDPDRTPRQHHRYSLRQAGFDLNGPDPPDQ